MVRKLRHAACVVLLRRSPDGGPSEVYLVERSRQLALLGGFYAFPGGSVDPVDRRTPVERAPLASAFCSCALRELFEECGVLAVPGAEQVAPARLADFRRTLQESSDVWASELADLGLQLDGSLLHPLGQWMTPPFFEHTFLAEYLGLWLPPHAEPSIWPGELVHGAWMTPKAALAAPWALPDTEQAPFYIAYPVLETLKALEHTGDDMPAGRDKVAQSQALAQSGGGEMVPGLRALPLRTPTLPPATHTNCYVLGHQCLVVVDPGAPDEDEQRRLFGYLQRVCAEGATLQEIWLTHHHRDHVGAAMHLAERYKIPIRAHADAARALDAVVRVDSFLQDNEVVSLDLQSAGEAHWQVMLTPGHAPGHLCFYEQRRRHLLSGDTVLGMGSTLVPPSPDGDMQAYMASLRRLLTLKLGVLFPGHGPPVAASQDRITMYLSHRQAREDAIYAALTDWHDVDDIVRDVYHQTPQNMWQLAQLNIRSHLEKLVGERRIEQRGEHFRQLVR